MFLKYIRVINLRCLDDVEISFANNGEANKNSIRNRTLIIGENGTGKSSILKAIALVTAGSDALGELIGNPSHWIKSGKEYCKIEAIIVTANQHEREISIEMHADDTLKDIFNRSHDTLNLLDDALKHTNRSYFVVGYGASRKLQGQRSLSRNASSHDSPRANSVATLFDREASLNPLESWAMNLDYRSKGGKIEVIKEAIGKFLPELSFHSIDRDASQLLFDGPDGLIPLEHLSDGYQNMAAWVGDLLFRITNSFENYDQPLSARGVLLIDEVDLHLHPTWQRKLLSFIQQRLPNFQLIATTHSVFTVQQAQKSEVYYIERKGKTVSLTEFEGNPSNLLIHQLLSSDLFQIETDESLKVEKLKNQFRKLSRKENKNEQESRKLALLKNQLEGFPNHQLSNSLLSTDEKENMMELLRKLRSQQS